MEGRCQPCGSPLNGNEQAEEEVKSPSNLPLIRAIPLELGLPPENGDDGPSRRLVNGALHQENHIHESRQGPQGCLLEHCRYTSLRDLLPPSPLPSPTAAGRPQGSDISIRNRLVQQAARSYLQPSGPPSPRATRRRGCLPGLLWDVERCIVFVRARLLPAVRGAFRRVAAGLRRRNVRDR